MKEMESRLLIPLSVIGLYAVAFGAFGKKLKRQVRQEQGGACAECGQSPCNLQIHHIVPQSRGGSDRRENAVGLCGEKDEDCHEIWDQLALKQGIIYPGKPISEATNEQRKNNHKR
jgi:5-methylcytosine-specific restriction endonuclease McrA